MHDLGMTFALYFASFFSLVNPLGAMTVFLSMTASLDQKARRQTATKAIITAVVTLIVFTLAGHYLFKFFSISVHGFRIVGGVIFFVMGYDMLNARVSGIKISPECVREYVDDISITPLGIPLLAGPGTITNGIVLMDDTQNLAMKGVLLVSILVTFFITWLMLVGASRITNAIGETGIKVMMKLMGLILMVIAVEIFFAGLTPYIQQMMNIHI